jgi:hypothetical protein
MALVEVDHNGHYFTNGELTWAEALERSVVEHFLLPVGLEILPEIIDIAE